MGKKPIRLQDIGSQPKKLARMRRLPAEEENLVQKATRLKAQKKAKKQSSAIQSSGQGPQKERLAGGKITKIEVQKRRQDRFNIYVDDVFALGVSENVLVKFALAKGQELSPKDLEALKEAEGFQSAYALALRYLNSQLRSEEEVRQRLAREAYSEEQIADVINKLKDLALLDDLNYGESYTRTAMRLNRKGPREIRKYLQRKGLSKADMEAALQVYDPDVMRENAYTLATKKFKKDRKRRSQREAQNRAIQHLLGKGYPSGLSQEVVQVISREYADEDLEQAALAKELAKLKRRHRRLPPKERYYKIKSALYQKGYPTEQLSEEEFFEED